MSVERPGWSAENDENRYCIAKYTSWNAIDRAIPRLASLFIIIIVKNNEGRQGFSVEICIKSTPFLYATVYDIFS